MLEQLELGLPAEALPLRDIPADLSRGQYLALWQLGCKTVAEAVALPTEALAGAIGPVKAARLQQADMAA
ncbi:hypothetical protein D3C87_2068780 [compost metagenome]